MYRPSIDWNPKQARLKTILSIEEEFHNTIELCMELHAFVHLSPDRGANVATLGDEVYAGLNSNKNFYSIMPTKEDVTIAWNLWHITRIEDITMNILVANDAQILNLAWLKRLNTKVLDTGNAMTDEEIIALSNELDKGALWEYRREVQFKSQRVLKQLQFSDLSRRFTDEQKERIVKEGGLTSHRDSIWLKNFWGRKDVAGILMQPLTRHQASHLNDCLKLKKKCSRIAYKKK